MELPVINTKNIVTVPEILIFNEIYLRMAKKKSSKKSTLNFFTSSFLQNFNNNLNIFSIYMFFYSFHSLSCTKQISFISIFFFYYFHKFNTHICVWNVKFTQLKSQEFLWWSEGKFLNFFYWSFMKLTSVNEICLFVDFYKLKWNIFIQIKF